MTTGRVSHRSAAVALITVFTVVSSPAVAADEIGEERSVYERLEDGEEHELSLAELLHRGELAFSAMWTPAEGGGRPLTNGVGGELADPNEPLVFPRNFNRVSAQDANGCAGCHNAPFGIAGGGGDFVTGVFVAAQRFDFATFDGLDAVIRRGSTDEEGKRPTLAAIGNFRATPGMFGSGFIEMLARQMTGDLQAIRDSLAPGESAPLLTKGVAFGTLARKVDGSWDTAGVDGLPPQSLRGDLPSLVIHPFHQSGSVVSIRQFTNNAFNHHHGMQSVERFGDGTDPDGDGVYDELTRADITAATVFQATLPVPGQVIPRDRARRQAIADGERLFMEIGCGGCHVPALPLVDEGWVYTEPNPYNPDGNLQVGGNTKALHVDLTHGALPGKRPKPQKGVVWVRAFTDLKLHDITDPEAQWPDDPNEEAININHPGGSPAFFSGNREFLTKKLWGAANERPYFHHGKFTTLRQATLAHDGDAKIEREEFEKLAPAEQDRVIEFLKSLQVLPPKRRGGPGFAGNDSNQACRGQSCRERGNSR